MSNNIVYELWVTKHVLVRWKASASMYFILWHSCWFVILCFFPLSERGSIKSKSYKKI